MAALMLLSLCWIWLSLSVLLSGASQAQKNITVVSGQNVILTFQAPNNNILVVEWSRTDLGTQYVLMYRGGHFVPEYQHPSFKNRVDLQDRQMKDGDVSLILKNVTINDAGTYECRIFSRGANRRKRANLKTDPITIIDLRVVQQVHKNIRQTAGETVVLPCEAPNTNSNPNTVEWSRADMKPQYIIKYNPNHTELHPSFKNRVDLQDRQMKDGNVSVILKDVTINDTGTYECRVFTEGTIRRKRATLETDPISIIYLTVDPPGPSRHLGLVAGIIVFVMITGALKQLKKKNPPHPLSPDKGNEQRLF